MKVGGEESCDRKGRNGGKWRLELYLGSGVWDINTGRGGVDK